VFPKVPLEMEGQLTMEEMAAKLATRPGPHLPPDAMRQFFRVEPQQHAKHSPAKQRASSEG